jgi:predicted N-formylglutamate amidohydrolase
MDVSGLGWRKGMDSPAKRLLATDEPDPVLVYNEDGASPFFLTGDHAGRLVPRSLGDLGVPLSEMDRHIAWDIGIAATSRRLADLIDACLIEQVYSRLVIDCNRAPSVPSAMPEVSESTPIPGNADLLAEDRERRRVEIFEPYHARTRGLLDRRDEAGRKTILVAMHSFTPVFKGFVRPWHVGVLYNRDPALANVMLDLFRKEGDLVVGDNEPYHVSDESDYGIPVHGEQRGIPHVELEIRQDLIAEPAGQEAWAERLARLLPLAIGM